jgi:hypothetical protein
VSSSAMGKHPRSRFSRLGFAALKWDVRGVGRLMRI